MTYYKMIRIPPELDDEINGYINAQNKIDYQSEGNMISITAGFHDCIEADIKYCDRNANTNITNIKIGDNPSIIDRFNSWVYQIGLPYCATNNKNFIFMEYAPGQLDYAIDHLDSALDWDEWQHLQICLDKELSFEDASIIINMLWENDIEVLELDTEKSNEYYNNCHKEN